MRPSRQQLGTMPATPLQQSRAAEELFTGHLSTIQRVIADIIKRHRLSSVDAEEFRSTVYVRLIEHDYRILREFKHRSSMRTFLNVVIERIYLDFRNGQWGKWRPSAKARRQGQVALLLERLLDRDGFSLAEAAEILRAQHGVTVPLAELSVLAAGMKARPQRQAAGEEMLVDVKDARPLPDELAYRSEAARRALVARRALAAALRALDSEDRRLLTMRFHAGLTVAQIARRTGMDQKQLYRRFAQLLTGLRRALETDAAVAEAARAAAAEGLMELATALEQRPESKVA